MEGADALLSPNGMLLAGTKQIYLAVTSPLVILQSPVCHNGGYQPTLTDSKVLGKGYVRDRLRSVRTILMTIFTIVFSLVVLVYGELILNLVFEAP